MSLLYQDEVTCRLLVEVDIRRENEMEREFHHFHSYYDHLILPLNRPQGLMAGTQGIYTQARSGSLLIKRTTSA